MGKTEKLKNYWSLEEKLAFRKLSPEEMEASIQRDLELFKKLKPGELEPFPDDYIDL